MVLFVRMSASGRQKSFAPNPASNISNSSSDNRGAGWGCIADVSVIRRTDADISPLNACHLSLSLAFAAKRTWSIMARRMISADVLKYLNGSRFFFRGRNSAPRPVASQVPMTSSTDSSDGRSFKTAIGCKFSLTQRNYSSSLRRHRRLREETWVRD